VRKIISPIPVAGSFTWAFAFTALRADAAAKAEPARNAEARGNITNSNF
jgi:hypothetical protein